MRRRLALFVLGIALAALASISDARADRRIALVIGNSNYANTPALTNPVNDASDVAVALKSLGFAVRVQLDASKRDFDRALEGFARDARSADAALVYYAGHGLQYHGRNYLMPVDASLRDDVSLRYEMVEGADVISALQETAGVKILILDACRDNPLAKKLARSVVASTRDAAWSEGLARPERINGMIVVYATQADEVAHDGAGRNSPFATAFLNALKTPGLEVGALFRRVEADVVAATEGEQSPELSISLAPEYYLNDAETDQAVWARIRANPDPQALKDFIARYPASFFTPDAEARLKLLETPAAPQALVTPAPSPTPSPVETPRTASLELPPVAKPPLPDLRPRLAAELRRLGCAADGASLWGSPAMNLGLARYARLARVAAASEPDAALLDDLVRRPAHFCPPECGLMETFSGGRCLRKSCPPNESLAPSGACVARPAPPRRPPAVVQVETRRAPPSVVEAPPPRRHNPTPAASRGGNCIDFNGSRICE